MGMDLDATSNRSPSPLRDDRGATTLEWTLLLVAIAIPSYYLIRLGVELLVSHYQMMSSLNALPFP